MFTFSFNKERRQYPKGCYQSITLNERYTTNIYTMPIDGRQKMYVIYIVISDKAEKRAHENNVDFISSHHGLMLIFCFILSRITL